MSTADPVVLVVEDDSSVRRSIARLIRSCGHEVATFPSAQEFLRKAPLEGPACLLLDVRLPGMSGLELQRELAARNPAIPIIFLTGYGTIPMSVGAMRHGALDFLTKPVDDDTLLDAVESGISQGVRAWQERTEVLDIRRRLGTLTPREREVLIHVTSGKLNKQIGYELGITEKTVKVHRARVMQKMQADSLAELVRLAEKAGIRPRRE